MEVQDVFGTRRYGMHEMESQPGFALPQSSRLFTASDALDGHRQGLISM